VNSRNRTLALFVGAALIATGPSETAAQAAAGTAAASVLEWNARAAQLIVGPGGAAKAPAVGMVDLAIVHTAVHNAVNAVEGAPFRAYGAAPQVPGPASGDAAVAAAGRATLLALFPGRSADIETWYTASLAAIPDGEEKTRGIAVGDDAAATILALRATDGRTADIPIVEPAPAPGVWVRTPPAFAAPQTPAARFITPWNLTSPSQLRPPAPPRLRSARYRRDYEETMGLGSVSSTVATEDQKNVARFWGDQPMLQWNRAWRGIVTSEGLSGLQAARLFAMLSTASSDALIACWDAKYEYMSWRPVTAIHAGGGSPNLPRDPSWTALVPTPPHPEYPAGHGCLSGAVTSTLKRYFETDAFTFTIDSNFAGVTTPVRTYDRFSAALDEVVDARVYGGMHYRSSVETGARIGKKAARRAARAFGRDWDGGDDDDEGESLGE
jgi:hypothetical protein